MQTREQSAAEETAWCRCVSPGCMQLGVYTVEIAGRGCGGVMSG